MCEGVLQIKSNICIQRFSSIDYSSNEQQLNIHVRPGISNNIHVTHREHLLIQYIIMAVMNKITLDVAFPNFSIQSI